MFLRRRACGCAVAALALMSAVQGTAVAQLTGAAADLKPSLATITALRPIEAGDGETVRRARLVGTGLFVTESRLVTSVYVVREATQILVDLADGRRLPAAVIGGDRLSRTALLEVREPVGVAVDLARFRDPALGEAIAIYGTGYGFPYKLSAGVVAGLDRSLMDEGMPAMGSAFEVSAKADPGMSGAPVITASGEILGLVLISTVPEAGSTHSPLDGRGLVAYNLLLPELLPAERREGPPVIVANPLVFCAEGATARFAIESLVESGEVRWGRIGLSLEPTPSDLAAHFGLGEFRGAVITSVAEGGPAAAAGLRPGDLLISADGNRLRNGGELLRMVLARPGGSVRLGYLRGGEAGEVAVALGATVVGLGQPDRVTGAEGGWLGILAGRTSSGLCGQLGIPIGSSVSVYSVAAGSPAASAGVRRGDVVVAVDGSPLSPDAVESLAARIRATPPGDTVVLTLRRGAETIELGTQLAVAPDGYARFAPDFDPDLADL